MRLEIVFALLLVGASTAFGQTPPRKFVTAPVLQNRAEIMAERQRIADRLLERGDSLMIKVFAFVDEKGTTRQPEVKTPSGNARADTAAMLLVRRMKWQPAKNAARGVMVTIPVMLVRKK
jgi:TonB family protein